MHRPALFIDDGGVMNQNAPRARQWSHLVGRYLAPRLGGAPEDWTAVNIDVATRLFARYVEHFGAKPAASWSAFWADYEDEWLGGMCRMIGLSPTLDARERRRLARECSLFVTRRVRAVFPGTIAAIRRLHMAGHRLYTASGEPSWELNGYLSGMRVRDSFVALYGPDHIDVAKASPRYYELVFAHAGIAAADALVVDDSEQALGWAAETGAQTILCRVGPPANRRHRHVRRLAELPRLLA